MMTAERPAASRVYQVPKLDTGPKLRSKNSLQYKAMKPIEPGTLGWAIREARLRRGMTQATLAEAALVKQAQISAWERGEIQKPDPEAMLRMDAALGYEPGHLSSIAGFKGARHIAELVPTPGAIVIEDPNPDVERFAAFLVKLDPETVRQLVETAESEYRSHAGDDGADNEAEGA